MSENVNNFMDPAAPPISEIELQRYMDGRFAPEEQTQIEERLKANPAARRTLDAMREEARLLREGLENLSEPPYKIADKVMAGIYTDYRKRMTVLRAKRIRNRFAVALSAVALLMVAFYMIHPREPAGQIASGNRAHIVHADGAQETLTKGAKLFDGDVLATQRGEFARLVLADGSALDIDEDSRVRIEKVRDRAVTLGLESGRAGIVVGRENLGFIMNTARGQLRLLPGSVIDLWIPVSSRARAPQGLGPWSAPEPAAKPEAPAGVVLLTVKEGTAYVDGLAVERMHCARLAPSAAPSGSTDAVLSAFTAPQALDSRNEAWAANDGNGPQDCATLGLFPPFDFNALGRRFVLTEQLPGGTAADAGMRDALQTLTEANGVENLDQRAARLSLGQQGLREITQGFPLSFEGRRRARVLEGLAHYERGRVLLAIGTPQAQSGAQAAFLAATVAFREALEGGLDDPAAPHAPGLAELKLAPKVVAAMRLKDFSPDEAALLLTQFYRPWALYQMRELPASGEAADAAATADENLPGLFDATCDLLGRSVEGMAARLGKARALQQAGRKGEGLAALDEICVTPIAGMNDEARAQAEGLRQAAHVERARLHAAAGNAEALARVAAEFAMRYPLELDGPAGKVLRALQASPAKKPAEAGAAK
ncbi:MAG: FecR domain-containing protein [Planctomycetes bacterium]|nr:FecR domain-containing protein [Planctomycetota bacterium]